MSLIEPLLVLQEIDTQTADLKKKVATLPKYRAAKEAELSDALRRQLEQGFAAEGEENAAPAENFDELIAGIRAEIAEIDERLAAAKASLEELQAKRQTCADGIPPQHLRFYERLAISHHPTIVKLVGNVCSGCHLAQPPATAHIISRMERDFEEGKPVNDLLTCGMCGRILY